jgi:hypothetical protein
VTAEARPSGGHGSGRMGSGAGVKPFSNVVRAAIPKGVMTMVSRSSKHGAHWTLLREARLCCPYSLALGLCLCARTCF